MGSRYVPPHMRKQNQSTSIPKDRDSATDSQQSEELVRRRLADLQISDEDRRPLYTSMEIKEHFGGFKTGSTLHDSAEHPGKLSYIVLFYDANPRWKTDRIIFAHTHIHILPGYKKYHKKLEQLANSGSELDHKTSDPDTITQTEDAFSAFSIDDTRHPDDTVEPLQDGLQGLLPVFMQLSRKGLRAFVFHGYFRVSKIDFLRPHSDELVRMLEQKFESPNQDQSLPTFRSKKRSPAAWKTSLDQEWAVLKLEEVPNSSWPAEPEIDILPDNVFKDRDYMER